MSLQAPLSGVAGNNLEFQFGLTYNGRVLNLTSLTGITAVLKASATADDGTGVSYTIGDGITVTDAALGQLTWAIPAADVAAYGTVWYRLDVAASTTAMYGPLTLIAA